MSSLLLIAIFKNEKMIMEEWIEHYINEGVDCFLLFDNGSNDNYISILKKYIDAGIVLLNINPRKYSQVEIYNTGLECAKKFDWVMVVDFDEFVYARNGFNTIKDYLRSLDNSISQIHIPWKMFGSSNHINQPKSVIQNFTWRKLYPNPKKMECKCITRTTRLISLHVHYSNINRNKPFKEITPDNELYVFHPADMEPFFVHNLTENFLSNCCLHLNHYAIQSWEFYSKVKMTRGDVSQSKWDNIRNKKYFDSYNHKDVEDNEIKNKVYKKKIILPNNLYIQPNLLVKNIEVVISRYNENLFWLNEYPFNQFQYIVYNKGINDHFNKINVKKIIQLPNVGVCDHTYLYHIVSNYDNKTLTPITIFLPGSVNMPNKRNKSIELMNKVLLKQSAFFIGHYTQSIYHLFKDFTIDHYFSTCKENKKLNNSNILLLSSVRPYGNWYHNHFGKTIVPYFTMNGIFSVDKKDILKYPKNRYEKLLNQLSIGANVEVAHYIERSWGVIFYPFIHTKILLKYDKSFITSVTPTTTRRNVITNSISMNLNTNKNIIKRNPLIHKPKNKVEYLKRQHYIQRMIRNRYFKRKNPIRLSSIFLRL